MNRVGEWAIMTEQKKHVTEIMYTVFFLFMRRPKVAKLNNILSGSIHTGGKTVN